MRLWYINWGAKERQQAFNEIKEYLSKPLVLVPPQQDRPFYVYLSVGDMLTFTNAPDLYTASARFVVAFPLEYSPKVYQSVDRQ